MPSSRVPGGQAGTHWKPGAWVSCTRPGGQAGTAPATGTPSVRGPTPTAAARAAAANLVRLRIARIVSPWSGIAWEAHRDIVTAMSWEVSVARTADASELARLAAECFPLACPPSVATADLAAFIDANLSEAHFNGYLRDPSHHVLIARSGGRIAGYAMLVRHPAGQPVELSKMYVLAEFHGGPAAELMRRAIDWATSQDAPAIRLGVNLNNQRAQRFYRKWGFEVTGTRSFQIGESLQSDFIMERPL